MSREFKATLEDEIGLDELRNDLATPTPTKRAAVAAASATPATPATPAEGDAEGGDLETVTEEMKAAAAAAAWGAPAEVPSDLAAPEDEARTSGGGDGGGGGGGGDGDASSSSSSSPTDSIQA